MEVLDTTIANVALRHIGGSLAADQDEVDLDPHQLPGVQCGRPPRQRLASQRHRPQTLLHDLRRTVHRQLAALRDVDITRHDADRRECFKVSAAAAWRPSEQSMFADTFPPEKRAQAFALYGLTVVSAPAIGPVLGGWLTDNLSWHWVFLINLPVGLLSLTLVGLLVVEPEFCSGAAGAAGQGLNIDILGLILVFVGFGTLQILLDRYEIDDGFSSGFI